MSEWSTAARICLDFVSYRDFTRAVGPFFQQSSGLPLGDPDPLTVVTGADRQLGFNLKQRPRCPVESLFPGVARVRHKRLHVDRGSPA